MPCAQHFISAKDRKKKQDVALGLRELTVIRNYILMKENQWNGWESDICATV